VGRFKTERLDDLIDALEDYCKQQTPFIVKLETVSRLSERPILVVDVQNEEINRMHNDIIEIATQFREPWTREELDKKERVGREAELLEKYGSPYVKELFHPHVTLAGPDVDDRFEEMAADAKLLEPLAFSVQKITILVREDRWHIADEIPLG